MRGRGRENTEGKKRRDEGKGSSGLFILKGTGDSPNKKSGKQEPGLRLCTSKETGKTIVMCVMCCMPCFFFACRRHDKFNKKRRGESN